MANEYLKVNFADLVGTHAVYGVHLAHTLPSIGYAWADLYDKRHEHQVWPTVPQGYGDYTLVEYPAHRWDHYFLTLVLDDGRFTFPAYKDHYRDKDRAITPDGVWEPDVFMPSTLGGDLVATLRLVPSNASYWRTLYAVDEATGLVILEAGCTTRDDDPNQRNSKVGRFRWENGKGWDSELLKPVDMSFADAAEIINPYTPPTHKGIGGRKKTYGDGRSTRR